MTATDARTSTTHRAPGLSTCASIPHRAGRYAVITRCPSVERATACTTLPTDLPHRRRVPPASPECGRGARVVPRRPPRVGARQRLLCCTRRLRGPGLLCRPVRHRGNRGPPEQRASADHDLGEPARPTARAAVARGAAEAVDKGRRARLELGRSEAPRGHRNAVGRRGGATVTKAAPIRAAFRPTTSPSPNVHRANTRSSPMGNQTFVA